MKTLLTGDVVAKIGTVFQVGTIASGMRAALWTDPSQWNITGADGKLAGQWTTDLKNGSGAIYFGPAKTKAEVMWPVCIFANQPTCSAR